MHQRLKNIVSKKTIVPWIALFSALFLTACSGGSSGGGSGSSEDIRALSLPDRIELTNVDDSSSAGSRALSISRGAYNDAGTDYTTTVKHTWVDDTDALDMVNDILGVVKDTAYENFINQGPYKALVRQVGDSQQSQSGSSTTSTTTEQLMEIYVDVSRVSNDDPMIVKVWVEEESGPVNTPMLIRGYFTVTQGVSAEYPYGVMTAHFKGTALNNDGSEGDDLFNMAMGVGASNGNVVIENVEDNVEGGGFEMHRKVRVVANSDVTEGNAYVSEQETDWETLTLPDPTVVQVTFNENFFKVTEEGETPQIYTKDELWHRVFRYMLFHADSGDAVTRNSGFPFETASGKHGYVGYYGLWTPQGVTINHGDTIYDMDGNAYTVFRSAGKLTKHTRDSMTLADLTNVELSKWTDGSDIIVTWSGTNFIKVGYRNQDTGQIVYYTADDTINYHVPVTFNEWDGAWCESLKAYLRIGTLFVGGASPSDGSTVYFHAETTLDPGTATNMNLYTWSFTLDFPVDQTAIDNAGAAQNTYWSSPPTRKDYTFTAATMMLTDGDGDSITLGSGLNLDGTMYQWGYNICPLTEDPYTADTQWQAFDTSTYYSWNTGSEGWNQLVSVIDGNGDFVSFDAPISFTYTHSTANDLNADSSQNGKKFRIEYDGFSVNIPWEFDESTDEWQPLINIKDGTAMGPTGGEYVIKGVEQALIMAPVADPTGITFGNEAAVGEPSLEYDGTKTALVGDVPTTAELMVIKGELIQ